MERVLGSVLEITLRLGLSDFVQVNYYDVCSKEDLGDLLLVRLCKEKTLLIETPWCVHSVTVIGPSGKTNKFPCYLEFYGFTILEIPEGKGIILKDDINPVILQQRKVELERNRELYKWIAYKEGTPYSTEVEEDYDRYWMQKSTSFGYTVASTYLDTELKDFIKCEDAWTDLNDIKKVLYFEKSHSSEMVSQMWKEDTFFGYQYLNGPNPVTIQQCLQIPDNFPVDEEMVAASLGTSTNLQTELENRNIFLADYKILDGVPANTINGKPQYLTAPLCLLWKDSKDQLVPIAIQLGQTPGPQTPIFLPNDPEWDWTLAKIWVRNADFQVHQVRFHILLTHLLTEVFYIATCRQLPMGHPVYKLIIPYLRFILEINPLVRSQLIGPGGLFDQTVAIGNEGLPVLLRKATEDLTYSSLCLPDDIQTRGMEAIPNYYYREDGMKIWSAVERLVFDIVQYYYKNDDQVSGDPELQAWVAEIFTKGFMKRESTGIPSSLGTRDELIKYLTMVIFTCSPQHAAFSSGQFDFYSWMPNSPSSMRQPPPTEKGATSLQTILDALPEVNTTTTAITMVWLLSHEPDMRSLGNCPDIHFIEEKPQEFMKEFHTRLGNISKQIQERSKNQTLTYLYMDPMHKFGTNTKRPIEQVMDVYQ
ncbi:polyunsaturated fatty acid lipoxygenase ALOX15B-like [Pelobates fuscus]|uniref:polyunsaturated fatty acid lipoxygenase ALOX15B-like n=1 Tax=Pelobates fuscus TaxID=191477 RepID=UPI002FE4BBCF